MLDRYKPHHVVKGSNISSNLEATTRRSSANHDIELSQCDEEIQAILATKAYVYRGGSAIRSHIYLISCRSKGAPNTSRLEGNMLSKVTVTRGTTSSRCSL
jgi:hypothetical protein